MNNPSPRYDGTVVVVGSGPVGMVSALLLQPHFARVVVLERQSRESFLQTSGFTFPIVFSPVAIRTLQRVGVWDAILSERSEYFGVVIHKRVLGRELEFTSAQDGVFAHWRSHIIHSLYNRLVEQGIEVHFEATLQDIDFEAGRCSEATLGDIPFDLLVGADGMHSQTRRLLAAAHPQYSEDDIRVELLDRWHAYRLPSEGALRDKFGGGERFLASHIFLDNLREAPDEKFRIISTAMRQPDEEINVLIKYGADVGPARARELNAGYFGPLVESEEALMAAWDDGVSGKFEHLHTPTFCLRNVLLVGDAAHGFVSAGDLINIGVTSLGVFYEGFLQSPDIPQALESYDQGVGESLRYYSTYALRRGQEKTSGELARFGIAHKLGLVGPHPSLYGIFEEDFEIQSSMQRYRRDLRTLARLSWAVPAAAVVGIIAGVALLG